MENHRKHQEPAATRKTIEAPDKTGSGYGWTGHPLQPANRQKERTRKFFFVISKFLILPVDFTGRFFKKILPKSKYSVKPA